MLRLTLFGLFLFVLTVICDDDEPKKRLVVLKQGKVLGEKYWSGDFYEFYGIPYATAPKGRDRFKAPLPPQTWNNVLEANNKKILCHQTFYTGENSTDIYLAGEEDCLVMNLLVPEVASKENLVPVLVYVHSGAFAAGSGTMAKFTYLARHDIIVVSFNFRLGAQGFGCLGNEAIPGNAGMKDQVAALKWINKNIKQFGGDPNRITLAGFSVGAAMAELLAISKPAQGLVHQLILESGSALAPYVVNRDPISTAVNLAKSMGYNGTTVDQLTDFYINAELDLLAAKSLNFYLPNSTFGFAPCIEKASGSEEPFLTESPLEILKRGDYKKLPILTGFSNMEGISRTVRFDEWKDMMNENFSEFIPADLKFENKETKDTFVDKVKSYYFNNKKVSSETLLNYIEYFSDSMFKYSIIKSANIHAANSNLPLYFYEFNYVGSLSMKHQFMDTIKGASHRDQTSYILDFFVFTNNLNDLTVRDRMTWMWSDFVKYTNPTAYESQLVNYKWKKYSTKQKIYLHIDLDRAEMKDDLPVGGYSLWDEAYDKFFWKPQPPNPAEAHVK